MELFVPVPDSILGTASDPHLQVRRIQAFGIGANEIAAFIGRQGLHKRFIGFREEKTCTSRAVDKVNRFLPRQTQLERSQVGDLGSESASLEADLTSTLKTTWKTTGESV